MKFVRRVFDSDHVFTPPLATISGKLLGRSVFFLNFYLPVWKIIVEETFINVKFCNYLLWNFRVVKYPSLRFFRLLLFVFVPCFKK